MVISTLTHGGAELQVKSVAEALVRRKWQVDLIVLRRPEAFVDELRAAGVQVHSLHVDGPAGRIAALLRLVGLLRRLAPDVVHSHMRGANLLARLARPLARPPVLLCTAHCADENSIPRGIGPSAELAYRLTDKLCDLTTNVSRAAVDRYVRTRATPAHRIRFVRNGIDVERFRPDPNVRAQMRTALALNDKPTILAIGRFHPQKNHELLVRAFARVLADVPNAVLLLAGQGLLEADVARLATALGIKESIRFLGIRDDIPALLNAADCYAMSSRYEGLPIVLLEAAATALPVVATAVDGNPEIIQNRVSGFLVPSDDTSAFADALKTVLSMPISQRLEMGSAGRVYVEREYALDKVVGDWEAIYHELLDRVRAHDSRHLP